MAEALMAYKGGESISVQSAGVFAAEGAPANPNTREVLRKRGIVFDHHRAQPVTPSLIQWADDVYTMTENHKRMLLEQFPDAQGKVLTLKEAADTSFVNEKLWDKWHGLMADMETTRAMYTQKLNQPNIDDNVKNQMESMMEQELQKYYNELRQLEATLPSVDISDPFGGSINDYERVCIEMEQLIDRLIQKHNND